MCSAMPYILMIFGLRMIPICKCLHRLPLWLHWEASSASFAIYLNYPHNTTPLH
ncbi:hypothetical protein DL93DRAFT_2091265 [Clavulina sp. PMI_390]|nr:hypothetical protein DL93DRAFT_2091265 [Clavulina sp. PMI_390]